MAERLPLGERADLWREVFTMLAAEGTDRDALLEFVPGDDPRVLARETATLRELITAGARAEHLQRFDLEVLISDPYVDAQQIEQLGATKVELPELFSRSDVVSLHAPDVPSTRGMVSAELLALMQDGTTFINTARPALVDEDALRAECVSGRIAALLDVHEDLSPDDALWEVPTVSITPHIAGSQGNELHRMGEAALEEVRRLSAGETPRWPVDRAARGTSA